SHDAPDRQQPRGPFSAWRNSGRDEKFFSGICYAIPPAGQNGELSRKRFHSLTLYRAEFRIGNVSSVPGFRVSPRVSPGFPEWETSRLSRVSPSSNSMPLLKFDPSLSIKASKVI